MLVIRKSHVTKTEPRTAYDIQQKQPVEGQAVGAFRYVVEKWQNCNCAGDGCEHDAMTYYKVILSEADFNEVQMLRDNFVQTDLLSANQQEGTETT